MAEPLRIAIPLPEGVRYANYFNALSHLGAEGVHMTAPEDTSSFDGLLLPGGGDIEPERYGQALAGSVEIDPKLDDLQFTALDRFVKAGKPVLGICRGHQVINVYFGGTLIQHLPQSPVHRRDPGVPADKVHGVCVREGSWLEKLYGSEFQVNSSHHQAVDRPGEGLEIDACSLDGVAEALHHQTLPVLSVQWHPERMCFENARDDTVDGSLVISKFLSLCGKK